MRLSRVKQRIEILDLKALCEFYLCSEGYTLSTGSGGNVYRMIPRDDSSLCALSRDLFNLFIRINLRDFTAFFRTEGDVDSIEDFFKGIQSPDFRAYVYQIKNEICNNKFVDADSRWSESLFDMRCHCIFGNSETELSEEYLQCLNTLKINVLNRYKEILSSDTTVLGAYSHSPHIQEGLIRRCMAKDTFGLFKKQTHLVSDMTLEFEKYCNTIPFTRDNNQTTVISKYLGSLMAYFFNKWFTKLQKIHEVGRVSFENSDGKISYLADTMRAESSKDKEDINLYELFKEVSAIDNELFGRKKTGDFEYAYYSIVDFVLSRINSKKMHQLSSFTTAYDVKFKMVNVLSKVSKNDIKKEAEPDQFYSRDTFARGTDSTFIARLARNKALLSEIYENCGDLAGNEYHDIVKSIITKINSGCKGEDSDVAYVDIKRSGFEANGVFVMSDEIYESVGQLIKLMGKLVSLNHILVGYGTSLAVVWSQYMYKSFLGLDRMFSRCPTVPAFLNYIGMHNDRVHAGVFSDGIENAKPFSIGIDPKTASVLYKLMLSKTRQPGGLVVTFPQGHASLSSQTPILNAGILNIRHLCEQALKGTFIFSSELLPTYVKLLGNVLGHDAVVQSSGRYIVSSGECNYSFGKALDIFEFATAMTNNTLELLKSFSNDEKVEWVQVANSIRQSGFFNHLAEWLVEDCDSVKIEAMLRLLPEAIDAYSLCAGDTEAIADATNFISVCYLLIYSLVHSAYCKLDWSQYEGSPLSDMWFIMDASYTCIALLDTIGAKLNTFTTEAVAYRHVLADDHLFDEVFGRVKGVHYSVDMVYLLQKIAPAYRLVVINVVEPLRALCGFQWPNNNDEDTPLLHMLYVLKCKRFEIPRLFCSLYDDEMANVYLASLICGMIKHALSVLEIKCLGYLRKLNSSVPGLTNYVKDKLCLDSIPHLSIMNKDAVNFELNRGLLDQARFSDKYRQAFVEVSNISSEKKDQFRRDADIVAQVGRYLKNSRGEYICRHNESTGVTYYLSCDLIFVGVLSQDEFDVKSFIEEV